MRRVCCKKRSPASTTNGATRAKVEIRRWLAAELGGAPVVLDCFAAGGIMWRKAYGSTSTYLGLDLELFDDERRMIVCDSRRYLRHADVDLDRFDLFDLDAFGSPLEHFAIICERLRGRRARRVGFALTDGTLFNAKMGATNRGLLRYVGVERHAHSRFQMEHRDDIFDLAIAKGLERAGLRQVAARIARRDGGAGMRYVALLAESSR